jgi:predicted amidophosphoribosyltransferase
MNMSVLLDNFLVCNCELCGTCTTKSASICQDCLGDMPIISSCCSICSKPLPSTGVCGECLVTKPPVDKTISALKYLYPADRLIKNNKYNQRLSALFVLAHMLSNRIVTTSPKLPDFMLPMPLHYSRFYKRGFNQSTEICKTLGRLLKMKYDDRLILRARNTLPMHMHMLNPTQRNVNQIFAAHLNFDNSSITNQLL